VRTDRAQRRRQNAEQEYRDEVYRQWPAARCQAAGTSPFPLFTERGDLVRVDDAPYLLEHVQRHIDPVTRARSTGRKAAKGANAPPMAPRNRSEPQNHITKPPAPLNCISRTGLSLHVPVKRLGVPSQARGCGRPATLARRDDGTRGSQDGFVRRAAQECMLFL
jgi:hypothetical protein